MSPLLHKTHTATAAFSNRWGWLFFPLALAGLHAALWTIFATSGGNPNLHGDSLEAYVWGHEFQMGYCKHPPFWAWIAGLWFKVFPHTDWAFYLLSEFNAGLGLCGAWAFLGRYVKGWDRLAGTALLLLTTFYTLNALRFNANTIQLSLWPWTLYAFVRSLDRKTVTSGIVFGLIAAAAMLSKYYAAILLMSCGLALLFHRERNRYVRSPAPWVAAAVFLAAVAPHTVWLFQHDFQPFTYAAEQTEHVKGKFVSTRLGFALAILAYHIVQLALIAFVRWRQDKPAPIPAAVEDNRAFLTVLGLSPLALTLLVALAGYRATPNYLIPICSLTPFLTLIWLRADGKCVARAALYLYALVMISCFAIVPSLAKIPDVDPPMPRAEIAQAAYEAWRAATPAPLRIVAGSSPYDNATAFYTQTDASAFIEMTPALAPWITPERIAAQGMLIVCQSADGACLERAAAYETPQTRKEHKTILADHGGRKGHAVDFELIVVPPAP